MQESPEPAGHANVHFQVFHGQEDNCQYACHLFQRRQSVLSTTAELLCPGFQELEADQTTSWEYVKNKNMVTTTLTCSALLHARKLLRSGTVVYVSWTQ